MNIGKTRITEAALLVVATVVCLGIAEFGMRLLLPASDRHYVLPPNYTSTLIFDEGIVTGIYGPSTYSTSSDGIRGTEFGLDANEYRILAIGGSTTQNTNLNQDETWTLMLSKILGDLDDGRSVWTGDVGRSGHTARSHVVQLEYLIPELPRIDTVLLLVGVNDMTVALRHGLNYVPPIPLADPAARYEQKIGAFRRLPGRFHEQDTAYKSAGAAPIKQLAIYQLASKAKAALLNAKGSDSRELARSIRKWRSYRNSNIPKIVQEPNTKHALSIYREYLEELISIAKSQGIRLVLMTQPSLWRSDLDKKEESSTWLGGVGDFQNQPGHKYFSSAVLASVMNKYNEVLLDTCRDHELECIDLAAAVPKNLDVFYDDVHFTEYGSALVAKEIAKQLMSSPPF